MTAFAGLQFGQHGVGHVNIVTVPCAISDAENFHIGVLAEVFKFVLLIIGVHCDEHGTNLGSGIKEGEPVWHIRSPDADIGTFLDANGNQTFGQIVYTLVELAPSEAQVTV